MSRASRTRHERKRVQRVIKSRTSELRNVRRSVSDERDGRLHHRDTLRRLHAHAMADPALGAVRAILREREPWLFDDEVTP